MIKVVVQSNQPSIRVLTPKDYQSVARVTAIQILDRLVSQYRKEPALEKRMDEIQKVVEGLRADHRLSMRSRKD